MPMKLYRLKPARPGTQRLPIDGLAGKKKVLRPVGRAHILDDRRDAIGRVRTCQRLVNRWTLAKTGVEEELLTVLDHTARLARDYVKVASIRREIDNLIVDRKVPKAKPGGNIFLPLVKLVFGTTEKSRTNWTRNASVVRRFIERGNGSDFTKFVKSSGGLVKLAEADHADHPTRERHQQLEKVERKFEEAVRTALKLNHKNVTDLAAGRGMISLLLYGSGDKWVMLGAANASKKDVRHFRR
jgi:hypothetical protein